MHLTRKYAPRLAAALAAACLFAAHPVHAQNIVQDGDFEQADPGAAQGSYTFFDNYVPGDQTHFDNYWVVPTGSDAIDTGDRYVYDGDKSLWLNPDDPTPTAPLNSTTQTLNTTASQSYTLSFYANNNQDPTEDPLTVTFGGVLVTGSPFLVPANGYPGDTDFNGDPLPTAGVFTHYTFNVTATGSSSDLTFAAPGASDGLLGNGVSTLELDDISVTPNNVPAVPEPSSVAAFAFTGLLAAGLMLRAKKRTA
jgi:hypothetical protein